MTRSARTPSLVKMLNDEFLATVRPKIAQLGFVPSTFRNAYFGTDEQGGYQYDFMRIYDRTLEMLYVNVPSRSRGFALRYQQFSLSSGLSDGDQLSHVNADVIYNPAALKQSLYFDPIWKWWGRFVPSPYAISRLAASREAGRSQAVARLANRLSTDLDSFDRFKVHWEENRRRLTIDKQGKLNDDADGDTQSTRR